MERVKFEGTWRERRAHPFVRNDRRGVAAPLLLDEVAEHCPAGIVVIGRGGRIIYANRRAQQMLGLPATEGTARSYDAPQWQVTDFDGHPKDSAELVVSRVLASGQAVDDAEHAVLRPDGQRVYLRVCGQPVHDDAGKVTRVVCTMMDVSASVRADRALRDSEARFAGTFEHAPIGMALVGVDGRFLLVNQALCDITGYAREQLERLTFQAITHPADLATDLDYVAQLLAGRIGHYQMEKRYIHQGGRSVWVRLSVSLLRDAAQAPVHFIAHVEDITAARAASDQLLHYAQELGRRNRELEQYAYVASHDLQAPLRAVVGFAQLLERSAQDRLTDGEREYLAFSIDGAHRMQALIQDLLLYARVGRADAGAAPADAGQALDAALALLREPLAQRDAQLTRTLLPRVQCASDELRQLLHNLIGNALKFQPGPRPVIEIGAQRAGALVQFSVRDRGIGIAPEHHARVFKVFARLHPQDQFAGSGIGLSLCQKIVESHGGRIWLDSEPGAGTTVHFTLPAAP